MIGASIVAACLCIRWPDARALENRFKQETAPPPQPFRVADFVAEPLVFLPGGRALPYIMPVALPSRFELSVEILATHERSRQGPDRRSSSRRRSSLARTLRSDADARPTTPNPGIRSASNVMAVKSRSGSTVASIPATMQLRATSEWLTFEPSPERPSHFRNLVVEW